MDIWALLADGGAAFDEGSDGALAGLLGMLAGLAVVGIFAFAVIAARRLLGLE